MANVIAIVILIIALAIAYKIGKGRSKKSKYIVWGITTMLAIAPLLSWSLGMIYGISVGSGWAVAGVLMILLPIIFLVGLITLIVGLVRKNGN